MKQREDGEGRVALPVGIRQRVCQRSGGRRIAARAEFSAESGARVVRGTTERHGIHRAARGQSPDLALPDASVGGAQAVRSRSVQGRLRSAPFDEVPTPPNQLRWAPIPIPPSERTDFVDGLITMAGNGNAHTHAGVAIHIYVANASMTDRFFYNADGEMLIVPQKGRLLLRTEMGILEAGPGEIAVIQRGIRFRVELLEKEARGYICENYGALLRLPDLGPIGANGLANPRDFLAPVAAFEDREGDFPDCGQVSGKTLGGGDRSLAAERGRLARELRALQV
jgi:hypothetical protein